MGSQINVKLIEQKFRSESFISKVLANICISAILIGFSNAYFSAIDYTDFVEIFQVRQYQAFYQGVLTGSVPLTASIGGFIAAYLLRKFSRMHCFLLVNFIYAFISLGLMVKDVNFILFFRLLQGCITGIYSSMVPLYIKQFSPLQLNAKMGSFFQLFTVLGLALAFFLSFIFSLVFPAYIYWRMVFMFPLFLIAYQSYNLMYKYHYETPKYLLSIEKYQDANDLLNVIYKEAYVNQRLQELKKMFAMSSNRNIELKKINVQKINENLNNLEKSQQRREEIKYHNNSIAIYAAIHISTIQQFSGISVIIGYGAQIVKRVFPYFAKVLPIFLHLQAVIACLFAIQLLKNMGRKALSQYGCLGCGIFTLIIGYSIAQISNSNKQVYLGTGLIILIAMFMYRFIYGLTIGPVAFLYIPQIVQPNIMPIVIVIYWLSSSLTMFLFPILRIHVFDGNPGPIFIFFGAYTLFSLLINHLVLVETKGKKQYQIRMEYDRMLGVKKQINFEQEVKSSQINKQIQRN